MHAMILSAMAAIAVALPAAVSAQPQPVLDYGFYKSRVEPIFLTKKDGHARCVVCHSDSNNNFHLEKLGAGANVWTEEQSRKNFDFVKNLVKPGDPASSRLLLHPLSHDAGGDLFHNGGEQFATKNDPDWQTIADWVRSAK